MCGAASVMSLSIMSKEDTMAEFDGVKRSGARRNVAVLAFFLSVALVGAASWGSHPAAAAQVADTHTVRTASDSATTDSLGCPFGDLCIWSADGFSLNQTNFNKCGIVPDPFFRNGPFGSWDNNQTPGTTSAFIKPDGRVILTTAGAQATLDAFNWQNIASIKVC